MQIDKRDKTKLMLLLQLLMLLFSFVAVCSKMAAGQETFSFKFFLYYGLVLVILFVYAVCWQQIIKKLPLSLAYSSKAVTVVWGLIWGKFFFGEAITAGKIIGSVIIITGIILYVRFDEGGREDRQND